VVLPRCTLARLSLTPILFRSSEKSLTFKPAFAQ
jgi:hypothetical protein